MAESNDNSFSANAAGASAGESEFSDPREAEIQRKLKQLNKPAVKSIMCPDGEIIDFVPIMEQPAFDDPLLKDHVIQMTPSSCPKGQEEEASPDSDNVVMFQVCDQALRQYGECPEGTVPIRRTTREDLLRAVSIENYGKKPSSYRPPEHPPTP